MSAIYNELFDTPTHLLGELVGALDEEEARAVLSEVRAILARGYAAMAAHSAQWPNSAGADFPIGRQGGIKEALERRLSLPHATTGVRDGVWVCD